MPDRSHAAPPLARRLVWGDVEEVVGEERGHAEEADRDAGRPRAPSLWSLSALAEEDTPVVKPTKERHRGSTTVGKVPLTGA
jgi:hypothetical protein